jgi:hypothetical protein
MPSPMAIIAGLAALLSFKGLDVQNRKELGGHIDFFCEISVMGHDKLDGADTGSGPGVSRRIRECIQR